MAKYDIIEINGTKYDPSVMNISIQDVHSANSGRDQGGTMRFKVVARKLKVELEWWYPKPDVVESVLSSLAYQSDSQGKYIQVKLHNPSNDNWTTYRMYRGDRSAPYKIWGNGKRLFQGLKFNLIEI